MKIIVVRNRSNISTLTGSLGQIPSNLKITLIKVTVYLIQPIKFDYNYFGELKKIIIMPSSVWFIDSISVFKKNEV